MADGIKKAFAKCKAEGRVRFPSKTFLIFAPPTKPYQSDPELTI